MGIIFGGYVAEHLGGYNSAFIMAATVSLMSVIFFLSYAKKAYLRDRVRS
jgi:predicted MFS family arabinose efflux permease